MKINSKAILIVAAFILSACVGQGGIGAGGNGAGGSVNPPNSVAYFQQDIGDRVLFPVNQHTLTSQAMVILDQQAAWLITNADFSVIIEGHADERGTSAYNLALSSRRANSVVEYLVSRGVAPDRLRALPLGKERPIAICSDETCYNQNRRAVTVVVASGLS